MNSIIQKEHELFQQTWLLKQASFEATQKKGNKTKQFERSRKLQKEEAELYKKQQFFKNFIKEMERKK